MWCKVIHCAGCVLANTRPHQHWGDWEMGTAISCTKCSQVAGLIQKVGRSSLEAYENGFAWKQYLVSDHMSLPSALVWGYRKHRGLLVWFSPLWARWDFSALACSQIGCRCCWLILLWQCRAVENLHKNIHLSAYNSRQMKLPLLDAPGMDLSEILRSMHVHGTSRRTAPCWVSSRTTTVGWNIEVSIIFLPGLWRLSTTCFYLLYFVVLFLPWLHCFSLAQCRQQSAAFSIQLGKTRTLRDDQLHCPPCPPLSRSAVLPSLSLTSIVGVHGAWVSWVCIWVQIDIPVHDRHVRTQVHCKNRSFIQSLALMRSAIMHCIT